MHVNRRTFVGLCFASAVALLPGMLHPTRAMAVLMARRAPALLALTLSAAQSACAGVKPWERGALAKRVMQLDRDRAEVRVRESLLSYREGSTGALGTKGGGCGCD